jgi:hypothetical protein
MTNTLAASFSTTKTDRRRKSAFLCGRESLAAVCRKREAEGRSSPVFRLMEPNPHTVLLEKVGRPCFLGRQPHLGWIACRPKQHIKMENHGPTVGRVFSAADFTGWF